MLSAHVGISSVTTTYDTEKRMKTILKLTQIKYHAHYLCHFTTCQTADQC